MYLVLLHADDARHLTAHVPRHLGGGVDHQTIAIHVGEADVRLGRALLGLGRFVGALDNLVRLGKPLATSPIWPWTLAARFSCGREPMGKLMIMCSSPRRTEQAFCCSRSAGAPAM